MSINLPDLDNTRTNDNKFAWFAGEGELNSRDTSKKFKACIDDLGDEDPRASHLYYQVPGSNWTMLSPTDSPPAPFAWFACPMDPGAWWVSRVTGVNMPQINLTGNSIKFAADSVYATGENWSWGESYTFVGAVAQYPVEQPLLSCLNLTASPSAETLQKESSVNFICKGNSDASRTINHFEFRVSIDSGVPIDLGSTPAATVSGGYEGQKNYIVPDYGCYQVECRACTSSDSSACTAWGQAQ